MAERRGLSVRGSRPSAAAIVTPARSGTTGRPSAGGTTRMAKRRRHRINGSPSSAAMGYTPAPSDTTGSPVCWGLNADGQASPPQEQRFAVGRVGAGG